jgi:transposase
LVDAVTVESILNDGVSDLPDLSHLSHAEKEALIRALWAQVRSPTARVEALEARLAEPSKTPDNSSLPPSKGEKPNKPEKAKRIGPRKGSVGRKGGGRPLACDPDETVIAKPSCCVHCQAALTDGDHVLHGRYDKIDLPVVRPVVTRVERYAGHCSCCGGVTLAAVPNGLEDGSPFSVNIVALTIYLRFTHAISYRRLTQLFLHLFALRVSEGALDAMLQRAKPCLDNEVAAILTRLRRSRIICSDETSVRIDGRTHWNWVFQNDRVVIHVVRNSRAASVVTDMMAGHRPSIWVSDLYGAQQGHADLWQICLAHQLRDCAFAIEAGDAVFAPRMKSWTERLRRERGSEVIGRLDVSFRAGGRAVARRTINERRPPCRHYVRG